jgi:hypothetical protein
LVEHEEIQNRGNHKSVMNRSKNEILKVIFTRKNWRVKLEVEVLVEYLCQNMGGREGVEINQVQEI